MNSSFRVFRAFRRPFFREMTTTLIFAGLLLQSATAVAPDWWSTRGVLNPQAQADDYAVANLGQLKHMAQKAAQEMNSVLPSGAGTAINAMITTWTAPAAAGVTRDDYATVNLGQLKHVAKPFYDRLAAVGARAAGSYPWSNSGRAPDDYAVANLGQLKQVFSFAVPPLTLLAAQTGIPSAQLTAAWLAWQAVPPSQRAAGSSLEDFDGDGITNLQEYRMGTALFDPADLDGDRIPNTVEDLHPGILNKSRFADAVEDHDHDGVMHYEEVALGLNLAAASSGRSDGLTDVQVLAQHLKQTLSGPALQTLRWCWNGSIYSLANYAYDDGLLTGHPAWQNTADANANSLPDGWEAYLADYVPPVTRVSFTDCDGDHMPDVWEYRYHLDVRDAFDAGYDLYGPVWVPQPPTQPQQADYTEAADYAAAVAQYQTDLGYYHQQHAFMRQIDPDEDSACNLREYYFSTNPRLADTDGDGSADEAELLAGSNPNGSGAYPQDVAGPDDDHDGIPSAWEVLHGLDPQQSNAGLDRDGDGSNDVEEYLAGSDLFDYESRSSPAIKLHEKNYGFHFDHYTQYNGDVSAMFNGAAGLYGGETYLYLSGFEGSFPITNSADRSQEVRDAFEAGGYDSPTDYDYLFSTEANYVWSEVYFVGNPQGPNWYKSGGGTAMELRITDPTILNAPAQDWSRSYLVVECGGAVDDYATFSALPFKKVLGSLMFSRTAQGGKSVTFQGEAGQVKVTGDRVEIIPRQEDGQAFRIALCPIEFEVPAIPPFQLRSNGTLAATTDDVSSVTDPVVPDSTPASEIIILNNEPDSVVVSSVQVAQELKIAKLEGRVNEYGDYLGPPVLPPPGVGNVQQFLVENDPDRFRIRVRNLMPGFKHFRVKLKTEVPKPAANAGGGAPPAQGTEHDDPETALEMKEVGFALGGVSEYISDWQLLVSDRTDDKQKFSRPILDQIGSPVLGEDGKPTFKTINDEDDNDPTHIAELGSKVIISGISLTKDGNGFKVDVNCPVKVKRVVNVKMVAFAGVPVQDVPGGRMDQHIQQANECLAQVGIKLNLVYKKSDVALPALVTTTANLDMTLRKLNKDTLINYRLLELARKAYGTPDKDPNKELDYIQIIYVQSMKDSEDGSHGSGLALTPSFIKRSNVTVLDSYNKLMYVNHIFVSTNQQDGNGFGKPFTLAHEIVHMLTNAGHYGKARATTGASDYSLEVPKFLVDHNLMRSGTDGINNFTATKRLYQGQELMMGSVENEQTNKFR